MNLSTSAAQFAAASGVTTFWQLRGITDMAVHFSEQCAINRTGPLLWDDGDYAYRTWMWMNVIREASQETS
jgi:hypothetical protein